MKSFIIATGLILTTNSIAGNHLVCATENQWPTKAHSGWLFSIDQKEKTAFVYKAEDAETTRQFNYAFENNFDTEYVLSTTYGDEVTLQASSNNSEPNIFYGVYQSNQSVKEEFKATCFDGDKIAPKSNNIKLEKNLSFVTSYKKQLAENYDHRIFVFDYAKEVPFTAFARLVVDRTVSDVGDWETTILTPAQEKLVTETLSKEDLEFAMKLKGLRSDEQRNPAVKLLGLVFARDWYSGEGRVGFAVKYKNQVIILTHAFSTVTRFGDKRLDYVY